MTAVMIGIDPHKGSHTAVAISAAEEPLGELRIPAGAAQADMLAGWAAAWPKRTWAVGGAGGLGRLLAQQLVAAGERVLDVPPKLASRVRLLQAGDTNKNDPNDALSVAVAALRSKARREVAAEDHAAVLKVWSKRHRDLARARNQVACRLHAVLCDLRAGGVSKEITAAHAAHILEQVIPSGPVAAARHDLAAQFLEDLRGLDAQLRDTKKKLAAAVGSVVTWRRAQMVLLSAQGMDVAAIAKVAFTSEDRVRDVICNFNAGGFSSLYPKYRGGRPPKFTLGQRREIKKIAKSRPADHGLPFSTGAWPSWRSSWWPRGWSTTSATRACAPCSARRGSPFNA
jgi:hypothetical protein